ncbi:MAG: glutathione S-transferase [Phenylobacterium sp.]|jgi:glutathione S-transferase
MTPVIELAILYSLHQCPYAMRARMGILLAQQTVVLRDIVMKDKPAPMLAVSPKAEVPVLVLRDNTVIDQSLDIMLWALTQSDPDNLLQRENPDALPAMLSMINTYDNEFVRWLKKYKSASRYHDGALVEYRDQVEVFMAELEQRLSSHRCLMGHEPSLVDYAILPFIRQLAKVERKWYLQAPYPKLRLWLEAHLQSRLFSKTMDKYALWSQGDEALLFGA